MHVLIASEGVIPAVKYGGIERVNWYLGKEADKAWASCYISGKRRLQLSICRSPHP